MATKTSAFHATKGKIMAMCLAASAVAMLAQPAEAGWCPDGWRKRVGDNTANVLRAKEGEGNCLEGNGGRDTFYVEDPAVFSLFGPDPRDYFTVIRDWRPGEIIHVPGSVIRKDVKVFGDWVYWHATPSESYSFFRLRGADDYELSEIAAALR
jgi:hypothetical protein